MFSILQRCTLSPLLCTQYAQIIGQKLQFSHVQPFTYAKAGSRRVETTHYAVRLRQGFLGGFGNVFPQDERRKHLGERQRPQGPLRIKNQAIKLHLA